MDKDLYCAICEYLETHSIDELTELVNEAIRSTESED